MKELNHRRDENKNGTILAAIKFQVPFPESIEIVWFCSFFSDIFQGMGIASGIAGIGSGHNILSKTMVWSVYPELYAIVAFAATFLISTGL